MNKKTIEIDNETYMLLLEQGKLKSSIPKSQTNVKDVRQLDLMLHPADLFVPIQVEEEPDTFELHYHIGKTRKKWEAIQKLQRHEKLRILRNIGKLKPYLSSRITFFIHPDNLVFDDNLMPEVIYRGIRHAVPPFEMDEEAFLKQYKCLIVAMFSKKYTFDQLYHGSLPNANETDFEKQLHQQQSLEDVKQFLDQSYEAEKKKNEKIMGLVPKKRFRLYKRLAITMIVLTVLFAVPLIYYALIRVPFQDQQLEAHGQFLADDYNDVISTLAEEDPDDLPSQTKYILAYAYIQVESLSDEDKASILNNVSLNSNQDYLLYWIYNGRGDFDEALDTAKYVDDPQIIIYGLIKKMEEVKNNPELSGTERDEQVNDLQTQLDQYLEEYNLDPLGEESTESDGQTEQEQGTEDNTEEQQDAEGE